MLFVIPNCITNNKDDEERKTRKPANNKLIISVNLMKGKQVITRLKLIKVVLKLNFILLF